MIHRERMTGLLNKNLLTKIAGYRGVRILSWEEIF